MVFQGRIRSIPEGLSMWARLSVLAAIFAFPVMGAPIIQNISGPSNAAEEIVPIRGTVTYLAGDTVRYGSCDALESFCYPNSATFKARREVDFKRYQTLLAERFNIPAQYLLADDKMDQNFQNMTTLLKNVLEDETVSQPEKNQAKAKFDTLTKKGGLISRFNRARALKQSLKWDEANPQQDLARFEKSQREFEDSNWPLNFVTDLDNIDPLNIFEPSTEKSWILVGRNMNRGQTGEACAKKGYRLPTQKEWEISKPWLMSSAIVAAVQSSTGKFWLAEMGSKGEGVKIPKFSERTGEPYTLVETHWNPYFNYVRFEGSNATLESYELAGTTKNPSVEDELLAAARTAPIDAVCISDVSNLK